MVTFVHVLRDSASWLLTTDMVPLTFRAFGVCALLPLSLGSFSVVPRLLLAVGIAGVLASFRPISPHSVEGLGLEFCLGILLGAPVALTLGAAELCGELFDYGRGQTAASAYAPLNDSIVSLISGLFLYRWWLMLLLSGGFLQLVTNVGISNSIAAPGQLRVSSLSTIGEEWFSIGVVVSHSALAVAAPLLLVFLAVELICALAARILPSYAFTTELLFLKTILGFATLVLVERWGILHATVLSTYYSRVL